MCPHTGEWLDSSVENLQDIVFIRLPGTILLENID